MISEDNSKKSKYYNGIRIEDEVTPLDFTEGIKYDSEGNIKRDEGIIKDLYVCIRPGNKREVPTINLESDKNNKRIIINNYGHGGIGWSTIWGSVMKSIKLLKDKLNCKNEDNFNLSQKIAVIGAGCIGYATVLLLLENGIDPNFIEIYADKIEDLTSHRSGAFLSTASVLEEIDSTLTKDFNQINLNSFVTWDKIEKGILFPQLKEGVSKIKAYFGAEKEFGTILTESNLDIFVEHNLIPTPEIVYLQFKNKLNLMKKYESFYFNTFKLMKGFYDLIINTHKVKLNLEKINSFDEIDEKFEIIFNCAGLGNMTTIKKDEDIIPIGGHIITLKNQINMKENFNYVIYSHYIHEEEVGKYDYTNAPLFYFMPKTDDLNFGGLLGGSLIKNYEGGDRELDQKEYKGIIMRTLEIFGEKIN